MPFMGPVVTPKKKYNPSSKMKKLAWKKIMPMKLENTMWKKVDETKLESLVSFKDLEETFFSGSRKPKNTVEDKPKKPAKAVAISVLDGKKAYALAIVLGGVKVCATPELLHFVHRPAERYVCNASPTCFC